jgi:hypothetical protein
VSTTTSRCIRTPATGSSTTTTPTIWSLVDKVIAKLAAAGYHEPSTRDARRRILAFFRTDLADAPANA